MFGLNSRFCFGYGRTWGLAPKCLKTIYIYGLTGRFLYCKKTPKSILSASSPRQRALGYS